MKRIMNNVKQKIIDWLFKDVRLKVGSLEIEEPKTLYTDTIQERHPGAGVTVDSDLESTGIITGDGSGLYNLTVHREGIDFLRPHEQDTPDATVYVEAASIISSDGTKNVDFAGGSSPSFSTVSADSRIDLLVINDDGNLEVIEGVEDASPTPPTYPTNKQVIAEVTIDETSTVIINDADIKDVRMFLNLGGGGVVEKREVYIVGTPKDNYTGDLKVFNLVDSYIRNGLNLKVYYDGVLMQAGSSNDYQETADNEVTFEYDLVVGRKVTFAWVLGAATPLNNISEEREDYVIGTAKDNYTGSLDTIDMVGSYTQGGENLAVYVDGVLMTLGDDYTETGPSQVTFTYELTTGQKVALRWAEPQTAENAESVDGFNASATPEANKLLALDGNAQFPASTCVAKFYDRGDSADWDFNVNDFTKDDSWHDLDLSSIVPEGATAVALRLMINNTSLLSEVHFRKNGQANTNSSVIFTQVVGRRFGGDIIVACDSNRFIEYRIASATGWSELYVAVKGWWK
ncbi:MAG: hypothetical protein ACTSPI_11775 [Candidatus Heimdallarchaeaceae archaeon]